MRQWIYIYIKENRLLFKGFSLYSYNTKQRNSRAHTQKTKQNRVEQNKE